ncbi:hypothetical protein AALP_AA4G144700 [Arabis alpina]|uniref:Protamine P1 family protein n=1 Tax=Arabis alpina TaxID=50452 RepID=A0A087H398_ARAAL|nr:hypothetical protein AALP_AA4G144700 [Arabis alpina]
MRFSSSRPISSPGRTENPPLLMRFLRTKSRSRSRSRSRSKKPIFFRRKNAASTGETQEPSSPKVTCMGQVRINRSKKPKPGTSRVVRGGTQSQRRCGWVKNAFLCHSFTGKIKPTCFSPVWRKWKSFSHVSFSRKSEKRSSSSRSEPIFGRSSTVEPEETEEIRSEERKQEEQEEEVNSITPPRNAFLLTRCRSAPYRSPSLGNNLWEEEEEQEEIIETKHDDDVIPLSVLGERESLEDSTANEEAKRGVLGSPRRRRLVLTRCNSEPSRIGEKLVPEKRRLGFT